MISSYYGIKFVWDRWKADKLREERITFNSNNPIYYEYFIPKGSKMLVYVLGSVQRLQGMYEVIGDYESSGDPRFNVKVDVNLLCDKQSGLTATEIRSHLRSFNPSIEGISYLPLNKNLFDRLYNDLLNKI
jgi:hypothetical protein